MAGRPRREERSTIRELLDRLTQASGTGSGSSLSGSSSPVPEPESVRERSPNRTVHEELQARFRATFRTRSRRHTGAVAAHHRHHRSLSASHQPETRGKMFTRNVFLITDPEQTTVPRGVDRQTLHEEGLVVNFLEFYTSWDEVKMRETIKKAFHKVMPEGADFEFEYLKPCFSQFVVPAVPEGHKWTGSVVKALTPQGMDLYVRLLQPKGDPCRSNDGGQPGPSSTLTLSERVDRVREMFPSVESGEITALLRHFSVETTVNLLTAEHDSSPPSEPSSPPVQTVTVASRRFGVPAAPSAASRPQTVDNLPTDASLELILSTHTAVWPDDEPLNMKVTRELLWERSQPFYKGLKNQRAQLTKPVNVEFVGEEGVDAGAIRLSYFEMLMGELNSRFFEGQECNRIPKKDWGLTTIFETAGMMVAHSILNGGPGLPCLLPAVYHSVSSPDTDLSLDLLPSVKDIPNSPAYTDLVNFIQKLSEAETDGDVVQAIESESSSAIISMSKWPACRLVTMASKHTLCQNLIVEELVEKRLRNVFAFRRGLEIGHLLPLITRFPAQFRKLFTHSTSECSLTAARLVALIETERPVEPRKREVYDWFIEYVRSCEQPGESQPSLGQLMRFITGVSSVPPLGLHPLIRVKLDSASAQLPTTESCFNTIHLPMGIHQKQQFFEAMNRGILYSGSYYGLW